jgi:hypothetical protein
MTYKIVTGTTRNSKLEYKHSFHLKNHARKKARELSKHYGIRFRAVKE